MLGMTGSGVSPAFLRWRSLLLCREDLLLGSFPCDCVTWGGAVAFGLGNWVLVKAFGDDGGGGTFSSFTSTGIAVTLGLAWGVEASTLSS